MAALFDITTLTAASRTTSGLAGAVRTVASTETVTAEMLGVPRLRTSINAGEEDALGARCAR